MSGDILAFYREVAEAIAEIRGDHAALEARVERMFRKGKVTDVDAANQVYRQEIGLDDDGNPVKSPWVPYAQVAGARKSHSPPSVGQTFLMISPDGDHEQAHGVPLTWSNDNPSPSQDGDTDMDVRGTCTDTTTTNGGDARTIAVGGASIALTAGKIVLTADTISLVGTINLGADNASRELALKGSVDSAGDVEQDNLSTKVKAV